MTDLVAHTARIAESARSRAAEANSRAAAARARNRADMPETAAIVDDIRAVFGPPVYLRFTEGGHEIAWGQRPEWIDR